MTIEEKEASKIIEAKWLHWFMRKRLYIFLFFGFLVFMTSLAYHIIPYFEKQDQKDLVKAHRLYQNWKESNREKTLEKLLYLMKKHLSIQQRYEILLAQDLLIKEQHDRAFHLAVSSLENIRPLLPYYESFAETGFLIAKENYSQALMNAMKLKEDMMVEATLKPRTSVLFALNLLRICFLEKKLHHLVEEGDAWQALEKYLQLNKGIDKTSTDKQLTAFLEVFNSNKQLDLVDFMQFRKGKIK